VLTLESGRGRNAIEVSLPASFVDYDRLEATWPGADAAGGEGVLAGEVRLSTESAYDGQRHVSEWVAVDLTLADTLVPVLSSVDGDGEHVNDPIVVVGDGLLLGEGEGQTVAVVEGCFTPQGGGGCAPVGPVEVPVVPLDPLDRGAGVFPFAPEIAGIEPGAFEGTVWLLNRHASGEQTTSEALPLDQRISPPQLTGLGPGEASLGQIVTLDGAGFVGPGPGDLAATTLIELDGTFAQPGSPGLDIVLTLLGEQVDGGTLRYVINEEDALGRLVDVRTSEGRFTGTARPIVAFGDSSVEGAAVPVELGLLPVRQVVWVDVRPGFVESLRQFGLRAGRQAVVDRILGVIERDYAGVNLDVRRSRPEDFALYSVVELSGPDPNGLGLLGYDNTPGKDVGNLRLYDTIGGVNALTQQDGYPGYGGVFLDSLFAYSAHPPDGMAEGGLAESSFDALFDPLRPDVDGGERASAEEIDDLLWVDDNTTCPARGRRKQVGCAVFALGNLVGTTMSHEIAHSLGLADPEGAAFHNTGDWTDAIMDGGSSRTFPERAEVDGQGPGEFCRVNYDYLRQILPTDEPDPVADRQDCY
jgi:hypothetical protein